MNTMAFQVSNLEQKIRDAEYKVGMAEIARQDNRQPRMTEILDYNIKKAKENVRQLTIKLNALKSEFGNRNSAAKEKLIFKANVIEKAIELKHLQLEEIQKQIALL